MGGVGASTDWHGGSGTIRISDKGRFWDSSEGSVGGTMLFYGVEPRGSGREGADVQSIEYNVNSGTEVGKERAATPDISMIWLRVRRSEYGRRLSSLVWQGKCLEYERRW